MTQILKEPTTSPTSEDVHAKRQRIRERRLKLWQLIQQGYPLADSVKQLAAEYHCTDRTLYYDWEQRHYWLSKETLFQNLEPFYIELMATLNERRRQAQELLRASSKHPAVQLGCLKLLHKMDRDLLTQGKAIVNFLIHVNDNPLIEKSLKTKYWNYQDAEDWRSQTQTSQKRRKRR